jgi:hypothetical protein
MPLEKPIDSLLENDLQELITNGVTERRTIEYKEALPGTNDEARKEFLFDVSSFANAAGGSLVYGIKEEAGVPIALRGIQVSDADSERLRLESMMRDGISPRVFGLEVGGPIPLSSGGVAFVIRVPRSWNGPHMVTYKGSNKFYSRNSAGKYPLNIEELRAAFAFTETTKERLRDFRADRLAKIVAGETPVPLPKQPLVVLHVAPLSAFESAKRFDAASLAKLGRPDSLQPIYSDSAYNYRYNFDGYLTFDKREAAKPAASYLQWFRNGILESVSATVLMTQKSIPSYFFERNLLRFTLPKYLDTLKQLGVLPPVFLGLTLLGISGYRIEMPGHPYSFADRGLPIDRDSLILPDVTIERFESNLDEAMKPVFDSIWNAAGRDGSIYYEGLVWKDDKFRGR